MDDYEISDLVCNKYDNLLLKYERVMYLKLFVDSDDENLIELYINAAKKANDKLLNFQNLDNIDAGFDLFAPNNEGKELRIRGNELYFYGPNNSHNQNPVNKLDYKVKCAAKMIILNQEINQTQLQGQSQSLNDLENEKTTNKNNEKKNLRLKSYNTGFYMYPRSSLSKTQLRLANSVGIIDSGYRGNLTGMFDVVNINKENRNNTNADYIGKAYERYVQICAPGLVPIIVKIVKSLKELGDITQRGEGGFGSTGK